MTTNRSKDLKSFAKEYSFTTDEETLSSVHETIDSIRSEIEIPESGKIQKKSAGSLSEDEYNALLWVYDEPRRECDSGPLSGLTVAIKDCIAVKDLKMTCASRNFQYVPSTDAVVVERLLSDGATIVGKANMEPFAFGPTGEHSEFGTPVNPIDETRVPGGSSSGSGVAVASGLVDVSLGTDTGGSIRLPAACCGLVGIKPTHSLVPRHGFVDLVPWTDTIGPLAKTVKTAAAGLESIAGHDFRDPSSSHVDVGSLTTGLEETTNLRIGVAESLLNKSTNAVVQPMRRLITDLENQDQITIERSSIELDELSKIYPLVVGEFQWLIDQYGSIRGQGTGYDVELYEAFAEYIENQEFSEYITSRTLPGAYLDERTDGRSYIALRNKAISFQQQLIDVFTDVDLLITPTTRIRPPKRDTVGVDVNSIGLTGNTVPFSLSQNPAVTVPFSEVDGVPISAQIVAPKFDDRLAIQGARIVEELADIHT